MVTRANPFLKVLEIKTKFLVFVLLVFYIIGLFSIVLSSFRSNDPIPDVKVVGPEMRKQYRDIASSIKVGLYIRNFPTFDFSTNTFIVNAMVWFEYNKNELMLKTIDQFSFENSEIIRKSPPYVTLHGDKMLVQYDVIFQTKTDIDFTRFPLDDRRLSIILTNTYISPNEMYFDDSPGGLSFAISDKLFTFDWKVHSQRSIVGYSQLCFDQYSNNRYMLSPKAIFTINFQKLGFNKIFLIFVPLFAAIFLALFSFLMSFNNHSGKATLGLTAITMLVSYRFVIQQLSPPVGYFTLTDRIFIFFLLFSFLIFIFNVLLSRQYLQLEERTKVKREEQPETDREYLPPRITERINSIAYYTFIIIFVVVVTHLILA